MQNSSRQTRNIIIITASALLFIGALVIALIPGKKIAPVGIPSYAASSGRDNNSTADQAFDEKPETAWIPAKKQDPRYEWIQINYSAPQLVTGIRMINGYGSDKAKYRYGAKVRTARILLSDYASYYWTLGEEIPDMQSIHFEKKHEVRWIKLIIHSIYKGLHDPAEEVGIAEIEVF
ncbi:MAG: discoidin domain-containing protein [Spirochaetota bacterium]|nr:discoidin domain-containing protein [Spirochaetota bacterium]